MKVSCRASIAARRQQGGAVLYVALIVLLLLGLRWLPKRLESIRVPDRLQKRSRLRRRVDLVIAAAAGVSC